MQTVIFAFQLIINDRSRQHASERHVQEGNAPQRNDTRRTQNAINRDNGQLAEGESVPTCRNGVDRNRDSRKFEVSTRGRRYSLSGALVSD